jgi:hypothetical protein
MLKDIQGRLLELKKELVVAGHEDEIQRWCFEQIACQFFTWV